MIRGFLIFVLFLVFGAALFQVVTQGSGYILIVWGKTSIEMSLWFSILSLIILLFLAWLIWAFLSGSLHGIINAKRKVFGYGDEKAQAKTVDGLIDYIEENWTSARKKLTSSAGKVKAPIINYLAAARSAYELGDEQHALELLHKAGTSTDRGALAVAISQARMQLNNKQLEQALATLERASSIKAEHPVVLDLRKQVYSLLNDWDSLKNLLPKLKKNRIGLPEELLQLELLIYKEQLKDCIENQNNLEPEVMLSAIQAFWKSVPNDIKNEETILTKYASQLMACGLHSEAEKSLASAIPQQWHGQWLDLYGLLMCEDAKKPLFTAEKWLNKKADNPKLFLALGRLCIQNEQWGRAVDYFEKSLSLQPRAETYAELARVLDFMGEKEKSITYYKKGLNTSVSVLANDAILKK